MFRRDRVTLPLVLLLTLIAGVLRFTALDRPAVWGDEAATYGRVCGTYQELLDQLTDSAFTPLHYVVEWWVGQGMPYWGTIAPPADNPDAKPIFTPTRWIVDGRIALTPFALRFVPALAGTLMIPAMYWLARQLFGPRVGLTAALLACFSAYLLVFSRDAKMYMPFWLMVTLHVACALWWVRSRRAIAWAGWVLCGAAMIGLHATGFYVLAIDALIVFTSPRQHWRKFVPLAGLVAWPVVAVPYGIYRLARRWQRGHSETTGDSGARVTHGPLVSDGSGELAKAAVLGDRGDGVSRHAMTSRPSGAAHDEQAPNTGSTHDSRSFRFFIWPRLAWRRMRLPLALCLLVGVVLMAAGPVGYYVGFNKKFEQIADRDSAQTDTGDLGIDWVDRYNADRGLGGHLLYTASAYLTGWEWPRHYPELKDDPAAMARRKYGEAFVPLDEQDDVPPRVLFAMQQATVVLLALLAIGLVPWRRAFSPVRARLDRIRQVNRVWPATRSRRTLWVTVWALALPWAIYTQSFARPVNPLDAAATLVLGTPPDVVWPRARWHAAPADDAGAAVSQKWSRMTGQMKQSWADVSTGWPAAWAKYTAAFRQDNVRTLALWGLAVLAVIVLAFVTWKWRRIGRGAIGLAGVVVVVSLLGTTMTLVPQFVNRDVWMPRYLGAALPALIVGAAVLIDRQPRGLRWATIVVFVLANMGQYAGRVWGDSEPRVDLMAADVVASQPKSKIATQPDKPAFRAYFSTPFWSTSEPGGGTLFSGPGRYYLRLYSRIESPAREIRGASFEDNLLIRRASVPAHIVNDLKKSPEVTRFVVWQTIGLGDKNTADPVGDQLNGQFRRVSEERWTARDHWRWVERFTVRRRTYERVAGGK